MKIITCKSCGKEKLVKASPSRIKAGRGKYCSVGCRVAAMVGRPAHNKGVAHSRETIEKIRQATLKQIQEKGHPNIGKHWKMSDEKRKNMARPGMWAKEKNPSWLGGVSPENRLIRNSVKMREWRIAVLIRDGRKCQECGSARDVEVDHIKPFALFPELRFEVSNGRVLCRPCHKNTPTYGRRTLEVALATI